MSRDHDFGELETEFFRRGDEMTARAFEPFDDFADMDAHLPGRRRRSPPRPARLATPSPRRRALIIFSLLGFPAVAILVAAFAPSSPPADGGGKAPGYPGYPGYNDEVEVPAPDPPATRSDEAGERGATGAVSPSWWGAASKGDPALGFLRDRPADRPGLVAALRAYLRLGRRGSMHPRCDTWWPGCRSDRDRIVALPR